MSAVSGVWSVTMSLCCSSSSRGTCSVRSWGRLSWVNTRQPNPRSRSITAAPIRPREPARLVVFIVVDQARYDYFTRFRPLFRGGLRHLLEESAVFADAHHDHAITTTSPGHASLATGSHPARSGIVDNTWFDRERGRRVHAFGDPDAPILSVGGERPG